MHVFVRETWIGLVRFPRLFASRLWAHSSGRDDCTWGCAQNLNPSLFHHNCDFKALPSTAAGARTAVWSYSRTRRFTHLCVLHTDLLRCEGIQYILNCSTPVIEAIRFPSNFMPLSCHTSLFRSSATCPGQESRRSWRYTRRLLTRLFESTLDSAGARGKLT